MAERRMFAKTIIDSDAFLEMPLTSQLLYFHLSMRADDEGFINKPKSIMRLIGCKEDDMRVLVSRGFIIPFESGVVVIKHWKIHNYIRVDRIQASKYAEERAQLTVKGNRAYTLCQSSDSQLPDKCRPSDSIDKDRLDKDRLDKSIEGKTSFSPPTLQQIQAYCLERKNNVDAQKFFDYFTEGGWVDSKGNKVKNWKQKLITWERNSLNNGAEKPKPYKQPKFEIRVIDGQEVAVQID